MRYDAVIELLTTTYAQDALKQQIKNHTSRKVYANEFTISQNEFSSAGQLGLTPSNAFQINTLEYAGETYVSFNSERYHVYRTSKAGDKTILYLERAVADDSD